MQINSEKLFFIQRANVNVSTDCGCSIVKRIHETGEKTAAIMIPGAWSMHGSWLNITKI